MDVPRGRRSQVCGRLLLYERPGHTRNCAPHIIRTGRCTQVISVTDSCPRPSEPLCLDQLIHVRLTEKDVAAGAVGRSCGRPLLLEHAPGQRPKLVREFATFVVVGQQLPQSLIATEPLVPWRYVALGVRHIPQAFEELRSRTVRPALVRPWEPSIYVDNAGGSSKSPGDGRCKWACTAVRDHNNRLRRAVTLSYGRGIDIARPIGRFAPDRSATVRQMRHKASPIQDVLERSQRGRTHEWAVQQEEGDVASTGA